MADMGRLPFDQNESEEELVAGWITEYSGMRFGLAFFAEYIHMILGSFLVALLFLGGWNVPAFVSNNPMLGLIAPTGFLLLKIVLVLMTIIGMRWAVPRFRIDQVVDLSWKKLLPSFPFEPCLGSWPWTLSGGLDYGSQKHQIRT